MYCYNCGQKINNSILTCPYCDHLFDQDLLDEALFSRTIRTIANECTVIPKPYRKTFSIAESEIALSDDAYVYGYVNRFVNKLERQFKADLKNYIHTSFLSKLAAEGENYLCEHFEKDIYAVSGYMKANGVPVTLKSFNDMKSYMGRIPFIWEPVYTVASKFNELQSMLDERLNAMDSSRKYTWVGGGFGIRGAIKGQIKAGLLNAGGSAINSIENATKRAVQSYRDSANMSRAKNEVMESTEFLDAILSEAYEFYDDLRKHLLWQLRGDSEKSKNVSKYISGKNQKRNLKLSRDQAIELLAKNPFDYNPYACMYKINRNYGAGLSELAMFCGIEDRVYYEFLFNVDSSIFDEEAFDLHDVGFDTPLEELSRIHTVLTELEVNNPGFTTDAELPFTYKEREYHQKIHELLAIAKKENAEKTIADAFSMLSKSEATARLIQLNDDLINHLLIIKFVDEIKAIGKYEFLMQFDDYYPLVVVFSVLIAEHPELFK